ncbi:MAG: xanthine dehydrogenase family protein molybdopterin-binding subunit [Armatimonadota bacterium]|nr:xanthine dehydrogenase family protein molybdopterin-binding subunit [Armatimonadota bacterium]MDR5697062.1 xanthine dehydrogenase family protein molybdopterin-binding subunit [Armatimonadota bacterium]
MAVTQVFGARVRRREDPRLVTGTASYTDDLTLPDLCYAVFVRSPHAHARIRRVDTARAASVPGVVSILTGADIEGKVNPIPCAWLVPNADLKTPAHPAIAKDRVRYVGDPVAVVVAQTRAAAYDAAALVEVDYEPLPPVVDLEEALAGKVLVHDDVPNNTALRWAVNGGDYDAAVGQPEVRTLRQRLVNQRLIPNAMETRATMAQYNSGSGELTIWSTTQNPHIARVLLSGTVGVPEHKLRVVAPEVGGGFGSKIPHYPEEAVVGHLAMRLGRPVKWTEDRRENYQATTHGRDHIEDVEIAFRPDGTIVGIKVRTLANLGAYLSTAAPGVPTILYGLMLSGPYRIPNISCEVVGLFTNTTPVDAYRGAGRPEATYILERMMDLVARELGVDPVDIRRRNFIRRDEFPYTVATGITYDSGDYERALDRALEILDYPKARAEQEQARRQGRHLGIGFSSYVEICGLGPSKVAGAVGFQGGLWESAVVRVHPTGKVTVFTGASPHGQGEETTFAQIVAHELGIPLDDIDVVHGDTDAIPMGWGTYGSRTTAVGGTSVHLAAQRVKEKAARLAAHQLEVSVDDLVFEGGRFHVKGAPDRGMTIQEVALQAYLAWNLPEGFEPSLEANAFYDPSNFVYPFGTHICVVEVDSDTGHTRILRYVAVDDCGRVINPLIVDGQVHGGIAQGIAQALWEFAAYDGAGNLLTGSMAEYAVPRAGWLPTIETDRTETPTPVNPMGVKGVGETGTIASTPAVVNAVMDALAPMGVRHIDMPLLPETVWRAMRSAKGGGRP